MKTTSKKLDENYKDENANDIEYFEDRIEFHKDDEGFYKYLPDPDFLNSGRYKQPKGFEDFDINKLISVGDVDTIESYLTAVMTDTTMKEQLESVYKAQNEITSIILVRDTNNNSIVLSIDQHVFLTLESAIEKLKSLKECSNCINCSDCIDTHNSISCHNTYKANNALVVNHSINIENISFMDTVVDNQIDLSVNYEEEDIEELAQDMYPKYFS